ncbi:phage tail tip fiber protein [Halomonas sp. N3-2A]|uniref:phage tail tip fiber protein n=1 Tax=Halomonas sp. N3-2A TaxID=2014541 RepID=UPI000B5B27D2|nr:hypothetical protein [Halomonas sp. N3-2A]ASK18854.1 hypothetical protein CEK60_05850 [Halomonas sp. N3-2A]
MNRRRRTLPPVPPKAPSELRPLIAAMTEILETGEGVRGDPLDRKVTLRDLLDSGIGRLRPGMRPGQDGNLDSGALPPAPDLSIPPAPANFDAQGGFYGMINLSWTIPGQQYRNHAYTNIFRSEEDNFANAEVIGREAGGFYTDYVRDDAVDPDDPTKLKGYYYWITFTSVADIEGPPNSPNGTYAAPLADLGYVIELLTGEIDAGVLAQSLREEIEKIPALESNIERLDPIETAIDRIPAIEAELRGPESLDGSVASRIAAEREDRIDALDEERAERIDGLTFEAQARAQAIQDEIENRTTAITQAVEQLELEDSLLALQQNVMAATYDANAASIYSMSQVRINDNEVFANQIDQLYGSVEDNNALILNERQIRIDQNSSLATQVGILSARLDTRPSLNSGFEPGADFDSWNATSGSSITPATGDVYSGLQSALVTSTSGIANPNTGGVRRVISPETAVEFAGHEIRLAVYAKQPASDAASEFALAYQVGGQSTQWHRFTPTDQWAFYDVVVDIPEGTGGVEHAVAIWGSTSGGGSGIEVDRLLVTFAETDIPEVTAAIEQIQQALVDQEQAVASQLQGYLSQLEGNTAAINNETETRATQFDALARDIGTMTALTEQNAADIAAEREAWSSAVDAVASDVLDMSARVGENEARITDESRVRATENDLLAAVQRVISASRSTASATLYSLDEVRLEDSAATALRIDGIEVQFGDAISAIELEQNLLADENQALSGQITTIKSTLEDDLALARQEFTTEVTRLDGRVDATAQAVTAVQSETDNALAGVRQDFNTEVSFLKGEQSVVAAAYKANAQAITAVQSGYESNLSVVQQDFNTQVSRLDGRVDSAAQSISTVQSQLSGDISTVQQNLTTNVSRIDDELSANARAITDVQSATDDALAGVQQDFNTEVTRLDGRIDSNAQAVTEVRSDLEGDVAGVRQSLNTQVSRLDGRVDSASQALTTVQSQLEDDISTVQQNLSTNVSRIDDELSANARAITTAQSALDDDIASVQQNLTTNIKRVDGELEEIGALYTAKVQVNGLIGGFAIYNDGTEVDAGFDVDRFWIGRTNGNKRKPFIIDDDVVYMNNAMIRNGSIQEGHLGPITIGKFFLDDGTPVTTAGGLIRADAIDVDNLSVAEAARFYADVQSGNYIAGQRGWRIWQNGNVEFNQGQFNGVVNIGNVQGAGALATKDSLPYEGLSGTTASLVLERANSGAAAKSRTDGWTRPGSTRINGNQIYTGDAYVDTLQVKGQAITIPSSAYTGGTIVLGAAGGSNDVGGWTNWKQIQALYLPESPGPIQITCSFRVLVDTTGKFPVYAKLEEDGVSRYATEVLRAGYSNTAFDYTRQAISFTIERPAKSSGRTFRLYLRGAGTQSGLQFQVSHRMISTLTLKDN